MASDRCWKPVTSYLASSSGGKNLMHVGASSEVWLCFFLKCLGSFCFFEMSLKCLVTKLLIVSAWFLVHVGWFMFQRFWIEILIGFWFMLPYFLKGAANWKGSHWILRFLNNPLIKSEVLIDMILQSSHWILLSMDSMVYGFLQHFAING